MEKHQATSREIIGLALLEYHVQHKPDHKICRFSNDDQTIHTAVCNLKRKYQDRFPYLKHFHFYDGAYTYSEELRDDMSCLLISGITVSVFTSQNETWLEHDLCPKSPDYLTGRKQELFGDNPKELKLFELFAKELGDALWLPPRDS